MAPFTQIACNSPLAPASDEARFIASSPSASVLKRGKVQLLRHESTHRCCTSVYWLCSSSVLSFTVICDGGTLGPSTVLPLLEQPPISSSALNAIRPMTRNTLPLSLIHISE